MLVKRFRSLLAHPLRGRVTKFAIASALAAATSAVVFPILYVAGASTTVCSVVAFFAGAIPNWTLNRRWAWQLKGRVDFGREVVAYVIVSALTLLATAEATAWTKHQATALPAHYGLRVIAVTASYLAVFAILFVVRFAIYELWIFSGRSRLRPALRSRIQVLNAARANRTP